MPAASQIRGRFTGDPAHDYEGGRGIRESPARSSPEEGAARAVRRGWGRGWRESSGGSVEVRVGEIENRNIVSDGRVKYEAMLDYMLCERCRIIHSVLYPFMNGVSYDVVVLCL